jgi:hypothetical protein
MMVLRQFAETHKPLLNRMKTSVIITFNMIVKVGIIHTEVVILSTLDWKLNQKVVYEVWPI